MDEVIRYDFVCRQRGCPGIDEDCSGRGICDVNSGNCTCNPGFSGEGCETPICIDDCNGRGSCGVDALNRPRCLNCAATYMGPACADRCFNGTVAADGDTCDCSDCYNGDDCGLICSGHGVCFDGESCTCSFNPTDSTDPGTGYTGSFCEVKSCPGLDGVACSGRGTCNPSNQVCFCEEGFQGVGCELPQCLNDCNGRGDCIPVEDGLPECRNCAFGWMGELLASHRGLFDNSIAMVFLGADCSTPCVNGRQVPMDSGMSTA